MSEIHFDNRFGTLGDHITQRSTLPVIADRCAVIIWPVHREILSTCQLLGYPVFALVGVRKGAGRKTLATVLADDG